MAPSLYVKEVKRHQCYRRYLLYWIFNFYALQNYLYQGRGSGSALFWEAGSGAGSAFDGKVGLDPSQRRNSRALEAKNGAKEGRGRSEWSR
jgi:hypothetical protein